MTTQQSDWTGLLLVSAVLLSTFILLFLLSSSVSLSYFNLALPMRKTASVTVFGKTLVREFPISYSHTEGACSLRAPILFCGDVPALKN